MYRCTGTNEFPQAEVIEARLQFGGLQPGVRFYLPAARVVGRNAAQLHQPHRRIVHPRHRLPFQAAQRALPAEQEVGQGEHGEGIAHGDELLAWGRRRDEPFLEHVEMDTEQIHGGRPGCRQERGVRLKRVHEALGIAPAAGDFGLQHAHLIHTFRAAADDLAQPDQLLGIQQRAGVAG